MKSEIKDYIWMKSMNLGRRYGCHQQPLRSFSFYEYQFPVCARCTGIILSTLFAYIVFLLKKIPLWISEIFIGCMFVDGIIQYAGIKESSNRRRFVTGFLGGFGFTTIRLRAYVFIFGMIAKRISK